MRSWSLVLMFLSQMKGQRLISVGALSIIRSACCRRKTTGCMFGYSGSHHRFLFTRSHPPLSVPQRLGRRVLHASLEDKSSPNATRDALSLARDTFAILANKGRTWQRLRHVVELACVGHNEWSTIADVGCDHGILAMALAVSGEFDSVVGVDASECALRDGALALHEKLLESLHDSDIEWNHKRSVNGYESINDRTIIPVDFRVGSGLQALNPGEANVVCIAGMGINTMLQILLEPSRVADFATELDRVGCRQLILQPTNSRPRNLIQLYDSLYEHGWVAVDERIELLASRWYLSSVFSKRSSRGNQIKACMLPGSTLATLVDRNSPMRNVYEEYVQHHKTWLSRDMQRNATIDERDERWLRAIMSPDKQH